MTASDDRLADKWEPEWHDTDSGALFSVCRQYRYVLWRKWSDRVHMVNFIGLNPSTADENEDDPTIRRCIGFAKEWGADGILMTNLFAFRATDPKVMKEATDPVGPDNDDALKWIANCAAKKIACWGAHGLFQYRSSIVVSMIGRRFLWCFGKTKLWQPKHPLFLPKNSELERL